MIRENIENIIQTYKDKDIIKVLIGIRRSGKSFTLKLLRNLLLKENVNKNQIIYIDFDDLENLHFADIIALQTIPANFLRSKKTRKSKRV